MREQERFAAGPCIIYRLCQLIRMRSSVSAQLDTFSLTRFPLLKTHSARAHDVSAAQIAVLRARARDGTQLLGRHTVRASHK